jgi:hypothetical protein
MPTLNLFNLSSTTSQAGGGGAGAATSTSAVVGPHDTGGGSSGTDAAPQPAPFLLYTGQEADEESAERNRQERVKRLGFSGASARAGEEDGGAGAGGGGASSASASLAPPGTTSAMRRQFPPEVAAGAPLQLYAEREDAMSQMARLKALEETNPRYVKELMHRGKVLNLLAEQGNLREFQGAARGFKDGDLLSWFVVQAFKTCMARGHLELLRHLMEGGFSARHVGVQTILHDYADASGRSGTGEVTWDLRACDFLLSAGYDVDTARRGDYRTPLHQAVEHSCLSLVQLLLHHGADVNAVARGGVTPLKLARAAAAADPRDFKNAKKIEAILRVGWIRVVLGGGRAGRGPHDSSTAPSSSILSAGDG